jgi:hypothetical protein
LLNENQTAWAFIQQSTIKNQQLVTPFSLLRPDDEQFLPVFNWLSVGGQFFNNFTGHVGFDLVQQLHGFDDAKNLTDFDDVSDFRGDFTVCRPSSGVGTGGAAAGEAAGGGATGAAAGAGGTA